VEKGYMTEQKTVMGFWEDMKRLCAGGSSDGAVFLKINEGAGVEKIDLAHGGIPSFPLVCCFNSDNVLGS
jgi:hypothetical protein